MGIVSSVTDSVVASKANIATTSLSGLISVRCHMCPSGTSKGGLATSKVVISKSQFSAIYRHTKKSTSNVFLAAKNTLTGLPSISLRIRCKSSVLTPESV